MKFCPTRICQDACPTRQSWGATLRNTPISPHPQSPQNPLSKSPHKIPSQPRTQAWAKPPQKLPAQPRISNPSNPPQKSLVTPKRSWHRQKALSPPKNRHWSHQGPAASRRAQRERLRRPGQLWPSKTLVSPEKALGPPKTPSLAPPRPKTPGFAKNEPLAPPKQGYGPGCAGSGRLRPKRPQVAPKSPRISQTRALSPAKARRPRPHPGEARPRQGVQKPQKAGNGPCGHENPPG